jgi:hypothetical protein
MGLFFGVFWGLIMWFLVRRANDVPIASAVTIRGRRRALRRRTAGYFRWRASKLALQGLPRQGWLELSGARPARTAAIGLAFDQPADLSRYSALQHW